MLPTGQAKSYPLKDLPPYAVVNDVVGVEAVVLVYDLPSRTAIPYSPVVDGKELIFFSVESKSDMPEFMNTQTRPRWNFLGWRNCPGSTPGVSRGMPITEAATCGAATAYSTSRRSQP